MQFIEAANFVHFFCLLQCEKTNLAPAFLSIFSIGPILCAVFLVNPTGNILGVLRSNHCQ